jgi:hypothetical protein
MRDPAHLMRTEGDRDERCATRKQSNTSRDILDHIGGKEFARSKCVCAILSRDWRRHLQARAIKQSQRRKGKLKDYLDGKDA